MFKEYLPSHEWLQQARVTQMLPLQCAIDPTSAKPDEVIPSWVFVVVEGHVYLGEGEPFSDIHLAYSKLMPAQCNAYTAKEEGRAANTAGSGK